MTVDTSKKTTMYEATKSMVARELFQHNIATPCELVDEMIAVAGKSLTEDAKILVLFNMEFVISLVEDFPWTRPNITLFTNGDEQLERLASRMQISTIESLETDMKFDLALANPPFSSGKKLLYPEFLNLCLDKCENVVMVMPYDMVSRQSRLRNYQETVTRHSSYVSEDVAEHFKGVNVGRISYVMASRDIDNPVPDFSNPNPFDSVPLLYPERKRMESIKSIGGPALIGPLSSGKVDVLWKIFRGDEQEVFVKDASEFEKKKVKTKSPWVVATNHCPSQGKFNTAVVKCDGSTVLGNWIFAVEVASKSEGNKLAEWLKSPEMVQHISDLLEANNGTYGASKALFARLPWFE